MTIRENVPLAPLTTFGVGGPARFFVDAGSEKEIHDTLDVAKREKLPLLVLSGGSNVIISDRGFPGIVLRPNLRGIDFEEKSDGTCLVCASAGENWDALVAATVEKGLWGVENLSAIPGHAGAAVIQNIGAYGQEIGNAIESVMVYDRQRSQKRRLHANECGFGYRRSIFNSESEGRYIILKIELKLVRNGSAMISYADVQKYFFGRNHETPPRIGQIRNAIVSIRSRKFADPALVGTAGSFFKNLTLTPSEFEACLKHMENRTGTEVGNQLREIAQRFSTEKHIKIPTAFLIDKVCGLKGTKIGGARVSKTQALAIINPDFTATAADVVELIQVVRNEVLTATGLEIELEPTLVGF